MMDRRYGIAVFMLCLWVGAAALAQDDLDMLAEEVEADNLENTNITLWHEGPLGEHELLAALPPVEYGDKLPGFVLTDADGAPVIFDRLEGPKLLVFWATWCGPCLEEFPLLVEAAQAEDAPFAVVFVNVWDDAEAVEAFLAEQPDALILLMNGDAVADRAGVVAIPTNFLIDAGGRVRALHAGNTTPVVLDFLRALARE